MSRVSRFLKEKDAEMTKYTRIKTAMWAGFSDEMEKLAARALTRNPAATQKTYQRHMRTALSDPAAFGHVAR